MPVKEMVVIFIVLALGYYLGHKYPSALAGVPVLNML
jgi:hypothetical protein